MNILRIECFSIAAEEIPSAFKEHKVAYHKVDCVNWPKQYPYKPSVEVGVAHTGDAILLHYKVKEKSVRAVAQHDQDAVWEDSCVEFFSIPCAEDGIYYNVECNCAGKVLLCAGKERHDRERAPKEVVDRIQRWTTLGTKPFEERLGEIEWEIALVIPKEAYFKHQVVMLDAMDITANFYKCGDKLSQPHFLSLFPIKTEKPDFHRPEFFKTLSLEL